MAAYRSIGFLAGIVALFLVLGPRQAVGQQRSSSTGSGTVGVNQSTRAPTATIAPTARSARAATNAPFAPPVRSVPTARVAPTAPVAASARMAPIQQPAATASGSTTGAYRTRLSTYGYRTRSWPRSW